MKQTAVEWLTQQVKSKEWQDMFIWHKEEVFEQAKAMEKEQIMDAVYYAMGTNFDPNMGRAELYYNTTYKSE